VVKLPLFDREMSLTFPAINTVSLSDLGRLESEQTWTSHVYIHIIIIKKALAKKVQKILFNE